MVFADCHKPYIQVEFNTNVLVSTVAVQGFMINDDSRQPRYVSRFQLAYKDLESDKFCTVNDKNGLPMVRNYSKKYFNPSCINYINRILQATVIRAT